jgi:hormone-sensitive lipase
MFTRRLRSLGVSVDLMLVDDLPHGFLNLSLVSRDAKHGADLCLNKLKSLLRIEEKDSTGI